MPDRLPAMTTPDRRAALAAFWAERRALARAAKVGLDFGPGLSSERAVTKTRAKNYESARESTTVNGGALGWAMTWG